MEILKENMNEAEKQYWSYQFYEKAYDLIGEKIPLVIPSYNRFEKNILVNYIKTHYNFDNPWPIYICCRKSQETQYKKLIGDYGEVISFEDSLIDDIGKTKEQIINYFKDYKSLFIFDDDVKVYCKTISIDKNGVKKFATIEHLDFGKIMASWQLAHEYVTKKFNCFGSCLSNEGFSFDEETGNINKPYKLGAMMSVCVCYNLDLLRKYNLNFRTMKVSGHDDLDLTFRCLEKGLIPVYFNFMSYSAPSPQDTITTQFGYSSNDERMIGFDNICLKNFEHLPFIVKKIHKKRKNLTPGVNWKYYIENYFIQYNNYDLFPYNVSSNMYQDIMNNKNVEFYFQESLRLF